MGVSPFGCDILRQRTLTTTVHISRNLLATRTRRLSLFQHPFIGNPRTSNKYIIPAMIAGLAFCFFFSYVPFFHNTFLTRGVPVEHIFLPFTVSNALAEYGANMDC